MNKPSIVVRVGDDGLERKFVGRDAWALGQLVDAGKRGVTPLQNPAPRWSAYVYNLRRAGLVVETETEHHGGPFAGHHGRYRLASAITVIERVAA